MHKTSRWVNSAPLLAKSGALRSRAPVLHCSGILAGYFWSYGHFAQKGRGGESWTPGPSMAYLTWTHSACCTLDDDNPSSSWDQAGYFLPPETPRSTVHSFLKLGSSHQEISSSNTACCAHSLACCALHSRQILENSTFGVCRIEQTNLIRNWVVVLYSQPFVSFGWTAEGVKEQVVMRHAHPVGASIHGRVDNQNKILYAKQTDYRAELFARAIKVGRDIQSMKRKGLRGCGFPQGVLELDCEVLEPGSLRIDEGGREDNFPLGDSSEELVILALT
ncbi:hypothetical protein B0H11DRAFT_1912217 [Mycena galericulata]|nr:hypothetical protein B0H11DRAFT_1912217 [Mycena galericulata]